MEFRLCSLRNTYRAPSIAQADKSSMNVALINKHVTSLTKWTGSSEHVCARACSCVSVVVNASWSDCRAVSLKHRDSSCRYLSVWMWIRCMQVCMLVRVHLHTHTITNSGLFSVLLLLMFKVIINTWIQTKFSLVWLFLCFCSRYCAFCRC